jgi:hypothetical protein
MVRRMKVREVEHYNLEDDDHPFRWDIRILKHHWYVDAVIHEPESIVGGPTLELVAARKKAARVLRKMLKEEGFRPQQTEELYLPRATVSARILDL